MPALRQMDAKARARSRSNDAQSSRHRAAAGSYRGALIVAGRIAGFRRALKDIAPKDIESGDTIELVTQAPSYVHRVLRVAIVERDDASALRHTKTPTVTLVTCYPFYFVGPAPLRFVVQGELVSSYVRTAFMSNRGIDRRRRL